MSSRLPCGHDIEEFASQIFEGTAPEDAEHQAQCRHCRAAMARIATVRHDVQGLSRAPVAVPASIVRSVMARVRKASAMVTIDVGLRGATMVAADVIAAVAGRAALAVAGVRYASVVSSDALATGVVELRVRLVVTYGPTLEGLSAAVRDAIRADIEATMVLTPRRIDVLIDDLA